MYGSNNLYEPGKSKSERLFLQQSAKQNVRFDGRKLNEFRDVELTFGTDYGTVVVTMGQTKVLANVKCELDTPLLGRSSEGTLHLNVSLNGVSFLDEAHKMHEKRFLTLNSLLERTFRTSRCLDLESLCVVAELYVWRVRVDVNILNHDGNLYDACTIGALAALMHYRRPDVTYNDGKIRLYTERERELVPFLFLHYPSSVTYCVYKSTTQPLVDPTLLEENTADTVIVLSFNAYRELCSINAGGTTPTYTRTIMQCAQNAAQRCKDIVTFLRKALAADEERRKAKLQPPGLIELFSNSKATRISYRRLMQNISRSTTTATTTTTSSRSAQKSEPMDITTTNESSSSLQTKTQKDLLIHNTKMEIDFPPIDDKTWIPKKAANSGSGSGSGSTSIKPQINQNKQPKKFNQKQNPQQTTSANSKVKNTPPPPPVPRGKGSAKNQKQQFKKQNHSDSEEETKPII